jgi:ATP-binding protein involved in chromosome partitioning
VEHIFGEGGADKIAKQFNTRLLGSLPLSTYIRSQSDMGVPVVADDPECDVSMMYRQTARNLAAALSVLGNDVVPDIQISED